MGRVMLILIMIFGVTLFVSLIREVFRAPKVQWHCKQCGLVQHDPDAVHCSTAVSPSTCPMAELEARRAAAYFFRP